MEQKTGGAGGSDAALPGTSPAGVAGPRRNSAGQDGALPAAAYRITAHVGHETTWWGVSRIVPGQEVVAVHGRYETCTAAQDAADALAASEHRKPPHG